jgi:hypothetical protein
MRDIVTLRADSPGANLRPPMRPFLLAATVRLRLGVSSRLSERREGLGAISRSKKLVFVAWRSVECPMEAAGSNMSTSTRLLSHG